MEPLNKVIALTQRPLTERGWLVENNYQGTFYSRDGHVWIDEEKAAVSQKFVDQPLLWEEIARLQQAYEELEQVGMPLNKFEALCASVAEEARNAALEIVKEVTLEMVQGFIGTPRSFSYSGEDIMKMSGNIAGLCELRIRALSVPSAPTEMSETK